jgi:formamidopyrimidine-DNA glycosylase
MPELPEVESLKLGLIKYLIGQKIKKVEVQKPKLVSAKGTVRSESKAKVLEFIDGLEGETILNITRRAKNLIFELSSGKILLIHLKMTGQLVFKSSGANFEPAVSGGHPIQESETKVPNKHTHITFELSQGFLFYNDVRMFGYLLYYPDIKSLESDKHFDKLGLDPLSPDFTLKYFSSELKHSKSKLKSVFLAQKIVVGLGNIYADEVCFEAGVRPDRSCNSLTQSEVKKLFTATVRIISLAVELGGSSVSNYRLADGTRGNYAREHKVYGRAGKPCLKCGRILHNQTINSRTTVFCSFDQK